MAAHVQNKIEMVDLKGQYEKIKKEIDEAIAGVLNAARFINGPDVQLFAGELAAYLGVKHVIPCANGTDALQIAMMALGLKPGDEVITSNFTFAATVETIAFLGLTPILVDVDPHTFLIDVQEVQKAITPKTKAIVPVHLFGQCADMHALKELARKHNLYLIEDTAQAIGAEFIFPDGKRKKAGTIGDIGTTSFFPSKNLGCYGDGGALFTDNDHLAAQCRKIVNHGQSTQYVYEILGINSRLDSIQAAVLRVKLKHLDEYAAARNCTANYYDKAFANHPQIRIPARAKNSTHVFHQYTLTLQGIDRNALKEQLASKDIPSMIYYPSPLHVQKAYSHTRNNHPFPVTEKLCTSVLSLPMHTELNEDTLKRITETVMECLSHSH